MKKQRMTSIEDLEIRYAIPMMCIMEKELDIEFVVEDGKLYGIKKEKLIKVKGGFLVNV